MIKNFKMLISTSITILILIFCFLGYLNYTFTKVVVTTTDTPIKIEIPKGSSINRIITILQQKNIDISKTEFKLTAKWYNLDSKLRHGRFKIKKNTTYSLKELVIFLTKGGILSQKITIPEGIRILEIAHILKSKLNIDSVAFVEKCYDKDFIKKMQLKASSLEGYLYPETYNFDEDATIETIISIMIKNLRKETVPLLKEIQDSKYSFYEILTLASIIQGEVMVESEAEKVSAVYNNRLKRKMLLQADPTIQYLFPKPKRLYYKDLEINSRYNTYKFKGLPPTPINNPSVRMIKAALNPAPKKYLYMVAKGNGEHYFNNTLKEHLRDKAKFDKVRKKVKRKNRKK